MGKDCQHRATHIAYDNKGRQYVVCTHCGARVG